MNIISLVPVHPCREVIIKAALDQRATLIWADNEDHFSDLLAINPAFFGILGSITRGVAEHDFIQRIRGARLSNSLYVMLLAKGSDYQSIVRALAAGADQAEYWPVDPRVLSAQISAIMGRQREGAAQIIQFAGNELNLTTGDVVSPIGRVGLTKMEANIVETLANAPNRIISKETLYRSHYGLDQHVSLKIIDVMMCKIRKKLSSVCAKEHIETVWGRGYTFRAEGFDIDVTQMSVQHVYTRVTAE